MLHAAAEFCEGAKKLNGRPFRQAVDGFLSSVLTINRICLHEAIEQFIAFRKGKSCT
jgi:hypothetical protein